MNLIPIVTFEDMTLASAPTGFDLSGDSITVVATPAWLSLASEDQCVGFDQTSVATATATYELADAIDVTDQVVRIKARMGLGTLRKFAVSIEDANGDRVCDAYLNATSFWGTTSGGDTATAAAIELPYDVELVADYAAQTFDVYVNGVAIDTGIAFDTTTTSFKSAVFSLYKPFGGTVEDFAYFDDLSVWYEESDPGRLPRWATDSTAVEEPTEGKKSSGWIAGEKPPAEWWNWIHNSGYNWTKFVDTVARREHKSDGEHAPNIIGEINLKDGAVTSNKIVDEDVTREKLDPDIRAKSTRQTMSADQTLASGIAEVVDFDTATPPDTWDDRAMWLGGSTNETEAVAYDQTLCFHSKLTTKSSAGWTAGDNIYMILSVKRAGGAYADYSELDRHVVEATINPLVITISGTDAVKLAAGDVAQILVVANIGGGVDLDHLRCHLYIEEVSIP